MLRAPIEVVQQRVRDRRVEPQHAAALADAAVVERLWTQFESQGVEERHLVDVRVRAAPKRSPRRSIAGCEAGEFRLRGRA